MSVSERDRLDVMARVKRSELNLREAGELLGLSRRQTLRVWARFKKDGAQGLVHGLRGRASNRRLAQDLRDRIVKRHQERYADFGPTLACEKLLCDDKIAVSSDTLTHLLKSRGLWEPKRRRGRHRKRRERRAHLGSLVQMDASVHDWFEGRGRQGKCVLFTMVDDATGMCLARMYPAESLESAFDLFGRWCRTHGVPRALYVDRHSIYRDADDRDRLTQFARAMQELGVKLICANSPEAKGRVERRHAVFQDRFVKELRLRGIRTMESANLLLETQFVAEVNRKFAITPAKAADLHRVAPVELEEILCVHERRVVGNDWCLRWKNRWLQIAACHAPLRLAKKRVTIKSPRAAGVLIEYDGQRLSWTEHASRPKAKKAKAIMNNRRWKPGPTHPWAGKKAS